MAVQARVAEHFSKTLGARGATWLRPCSDPSAPTVLSTHAGARDALRAELFFTCATMLAEGELLTRGASFCRVAVPWADVQPLLDRARGADLSTFLVRLDELSAEGGVSGDVLAHLRGEYYTC